ncbi:hypothetical protein LTR85_010709 [Meristemomyces frigidus]|nr:hypothetical protein LTR85_010709 [Meristemomyces frigidus]
MSDTARQAPKFPWDYDVPATAFWNSLDYRTARAFLSCYTEPEIARMDLDDSLTPDERLKHLRSILNYTFEAKTNEVTPASLCDVDHASWSSLKMALGAVEHDLGNADAYEAITREMYDKGANGGKDMSALHRLSGLLEQSGRYAEAEAAAREVLPWLQGHALLGCAESPQALGCMRVLVSSTWKQKRYVEAEKWITKCRSAIEKMRTGRFAKYHDEEKEQLESDVEALRQWRSQHEAL